VSIAVVSDIHGNRQAFEAVLEAIEATGCEEIWCLGDLVGYGADPDVCVELAEHNLSLCLAGNHDLAVIGAIDLADFSSTARRAAEWTRETVAASAMRYLSSLEPRDEQHDVALYHASPRDPVWEYVLSPLQAELCFEVQARRVSLIGHSHVALSFWRFDGEMATGQTRGGGEQLDIAAGHWLINPGSVGQPRDGDPRAAWLELDLGSWSVMYHRTDYDIEGAVVAILRARLPESLAERLRYGQ
jgi:predicted phosphodiesterase